MAKAKAARVPPTNTEIRRMMLQYFYDRNKNATSVRGKKGSAVKISDVKRELKAAHGLTQQEVQSNLTYLISQGWVEEDKVPTTLTTLVRGQRAIIARPEIVARYGSPPGGGRISPRQGMPDHSVAERPRLDTGPPAEPSAPTASMAAPAAPPEIARGYVVHVDTTRIVIDLTASDGVAPGSGVSLRRDRVPIIHPVTGELLGELDEEVATARVVETRERFSVAEIESVTPGTQVQVRDRVVIK